MPSKRSGSKKPLEGLLFTQTYAETDIESAAQRLLREIKSRAIKRKPLVVSCVGEMGAGKSTLIRACLKLLKADGDFKGSPTYALAHEYETLLGRVAHMDWYRIETSDELENMGMRDYLSGRYAVLFIEWSDRFPEWLKGCTILLVALAHQNNLRSLSVSRF